MSLAVTDLIGHARSTVHDERSTRWDKMFMERAVQQAVQTLAAAEPEAFMDADGDISVPPLTSVVDGYTLAVDELYLPFFTAFMAAACFSADAGDQRDKIRADEFKAEWRAFLSPRE
jgi:hypothetical protein